MVTDVKNAFVIYGPNEGSLTVKSVRKTLNTVNTQELSGTIGYNGQV